MQMNKRRILPHPRTACIVAALLMPACPRAQGAQDSHPYASPWRTPWDYDGARGSEHWGDLDPAYAACRGKEQSPIDIEDTQKTSLPPLRFEYQGGPLKYVINNGHTIRVNYYAPGSGDFLIVGDRRYELIQFHFHHPSEEYIHGKRFDMVLHLIHEARDGAAADVAILLKMGGANRTIRQIWEHMPRKEGQNMPSGIKINPADLLPRDTASYYTYTGSVTAPPCTEGVTWFVLKTPVTISAQQIKAFAELYPADVRPVQPLNGRAVKESR